MATSPEVILITGASKGIGEALAYAYARRGAHVALAARRKAELERVAATCVSLGGVALVLPTDVTDEAQCAQMVAATVARFGRLDTFVANAGATQYARFDDVQDLAIMREIIAVNFYGPVYGTRYALPHLKQSGGRIVGISSLTGKLGVPTRSFYAASKHAMAGFFDSLRIELLTSGVSVTLIYPGFVATGTRSNATGPDGKPVTESQINESGVMSVETCAAVCLKAADARQREVVLTAKGKLSLWLKLLAPAWLDRLAQQAVNQVKRH